MSTASLAYGLRRPPRERKIPGSNPARAEIFPGSSHTSDLKIGTPVATLPGAWRYKVSAGTGRPGVSILLLGEMESLVCNFYLSVAARKIEQIRPSNILACCWDVKQPTNSQCRRRQCDHKAAEAGRARGCLQASVVADSKEYTIRQIGQVHGNTLASSPMASENLVGRMKLTTPSSAELTIILSAAGIFSAPKSLQSLRFSQGLSKVLHFGLNNSGHCEQLPYHSFERERERER